MASLPSSIRLFLGLAGVMVMGPWFLRDSGSSELLSVTFNVVALTMMSIIDSSVRFRTGPWRGTVPGLLVFGMCIGAFALLASRCSRDSPFCSIGFDAEELR